MTMFWKKWFSVKKNEKLSNELTADVRAVVLTDLGCIRTNNEDSARFIRSSSPNVRRQKGFLAIVADGMGGHAAGEVASKMAVETVAQSYYARDESVEDSLVFALSKANKDIWQKANSDTHKKGMGTTCTAVVIRDKNIYIAHVGDSRAYLYQNGRLIQLSTDHTYVQNLVNQGVITAEEADKHPDRNILTRAMGTNQKVEIDILTTPQHFEDGNRLMLCSDGLYDYLSNDEIASFMVVSRLNEAAQQMIDLAKKRGGHDNITVLLAERVSPDTFKTDYPTEVVN
jgi:PPM family protein phosphatase